MEDAKKASENVPLQSPPVTTATTTPDYAAGLSSTPSYAPATPQPAVTLTGKCECYFLKNMHFCVCSKIFFVHFLSRQSKCLPAFYLVYIAD